MQSAVNQRHVVANLLEKANKYQNFANAWFAEESTPCALSTKIEPDSRGLEPDIERFGSASGQNVAHVARVPAATACSSDASVYSSRGCGGDLPRFGFSVFAGTGG